MAQRETSWTEAEDTASLCPVSLGRALFMGAQRRTGVLGAGRGATRGQPLICPDTQASVLTARNGEGTLGQGLRPGAPEQWDLREMGEDSGEGLERAEPRGAPGQDASQGGSAL